MYVCNISILPFLLKDTLAGDRILGWQVQGTFFSFPTTLKLLLHCLLLFALLLTTYLISLPLFPLCNKPFLSDCFFCVTVFELFDYGCHGVVFFIFLVFIIHWASWNCVFIVWKCLGHRSFSIFPSSIFSSAVLICLYVKLLEVALPADALFFFVSFWITSITMPLNSINFCHIYCTSNSSQCGFHLKHCLFHL